MLQLEQQLLKADLEMKWEMQSRAERVNLPTVENERETFQEFKWKSIKAVLHIHIYQALEPGGTHSGVQ